MTSSLKKIFGASDLIGIVVGKLFQRDLRNKLIKYNCS